MTNFDLDCSTYETLVDTTEGRVALGWKSLPAAPVAPRFDPAWLPRALRDMAEAVSANISAPLDLPALIGLGVASSCACGRVSVQLKPDWQEPAQLFVLCAMGSGEGKTPVFRHMAGSLWRWQAAENRARIVRVEQDRAELETLQAAKAKATKRGDTIEARGIARQIAEFSQTRLLTRFTGGNVTPERLAQLMQENGGATAILDDEGEAFDLLAGRYQDQPDLTPFLAGYSGGKPLTVERKSGTVIVDTPALSVLALTQPFVLSSVLGDDRMRGKGLLARFLIACPEPMREYGDEPDLPAAVVRSYEEAVARLLALPSCRLTLSAEAREVFFAWRAEVRKRQWDDLNALQRDGFTAKFAGNTARLAACLHLWEQSPGDEISAATMRDAVALARYFAGHLLHLLGGEGGLTGAAREALGWMVQRGEPVQRARDIKQGLAKRKLFRAEGAAEAALDELCKAGYIQREQERGDGRPVLLVRLHPDLLPQKESVAL